MVIIDRSKIIPRIHVVSTTPRKEGMLIYMNRWQRRLLTKKPNRTKKQLQEQLRYSKRLREVRA